MSIDWQALAGLGFSAFALPAGSKAPFNSAWSTFGERKPTEEEIAAWAALPELNAGIATGALSGVVVLDVKDTAVPALTAMIAQIAAPDQRAVPETPIVRTPSGRHLYFAYPRWPVVRLRAPRRPAGVDILGDGRFAVAPGSVVAGHVYGWEAGFSPAEKPFPPLPSWLIAMIDRTAG